MAETIAVNTPQFAAWLGLTPSLAGVDVDESTALNLSAVWRSVNVIAGTLSTLPLRTLREKPDGSLERVRSVFDNPGGEDGPTPQGWKETVFAHILLHGNAYLFKVENAAGAVVRLEPFHPEGVRVQGPTPEDIKNGDLPAGGKWFYVTMDDGTAAKLDATKILHVMGLSLDGIVGLSPITIARTGLGTAIAGDRAAARMFSSGALISGLVTPEDELGLDDPDEVRRQLDSRVGGWENAGSIALINRRLKFQPFTMSAVDAQFLQSRQFSIEEISRWWGVHPSMLMQTDKQTSWGTGIEEQNRALGRTVLQPVGMRLEQAGSRLLASPRFLEFDFAALERPSPKDEIDLLLRQTGGKPILTVNEARALRNLEPVPGGDTLETSTPAPAPAGEDTQDAPAE